MVLKGFLQRVKSEEILDEEADYIELDAVSDKPKGKLLIKIETLSEFADTDRIQAQLRGGHIVWVKIKSLREKDMTELKRCVDRLRKTVIAVNGDIAGVDEDFLVLTPEHVRVHRG